MPILIPNPPPYPTIYSYAKFSEAQQELANRLYDPTMQFWSQPELALLINDALSTWNSLTSYWRGDFLFTPTAGNAWYDLTTQANSLRPMTVPDIALYTFMEYQLLEPATGINPWTGSAQFTADDLLRAVQRRMNEILSIAGCTITRRSVGAVAGRITLPDTVIDIRRMAYFPAVGSPSTMWQDDTWAEMSFNASYLQTSPNAPGTPFAYLQTTQPPISFDVDVPPGAAGSYELLTVESGPSLTAITPSYIPIPNDWTYVLRWGALADLLNRESNSKDAPRAQYCETRYRMGLKMLDAAAALLALRMNNVPVEIDSVRAADQYKTSWQAAPQGKPQYGHYAGLNLLALTPPPDAGMYSATATVVRNAPLPPTQNDFIQIGRDEYDVILDYAQHVAAFKMGGAEFFATMPLLERFIKQAAIYGLKLNEIAEFTSMLYGLGSREKDMHPVMQPTDTTGSDG